jgi:protein-tyrosine-phosphatase
MPLPGNPSHQANANPRICICFVCEADPSRAFIAEAFVRSLGRRTAEAWADGDPAKVHPAARQVMADIRVPLREARATPPSNVDAPDVVVVIQNRDLPLLAEGLSWRFDDPAQAGDETSQLQAFRRVRDEIKRRVDLLLLVTAAPPRADRAWKPSVSAPSGGANEQGSGDRPPARAAG